jgi:RNA methyltransferase, TrmH family
MRAAMSALHITSTTNPRVKAAAKLRDRSGRNDQGRIIIDGVREISLAIASGIEVAELFYFPELCHGEAHTDLLAAASAAKASLLEVTPQVMEKLAYGQRVESVVAVAATPRRTLADLRLDKSALVAVVEGVEKPGNLGAILRTADAAGVSALIVADGGTDLYNPNAIRASLGAIFTVPVATAASAATLDWLRQNQFRILAARVDASTDYTAADYRGPTALLLGSEAHGLSDLWQDADITPIRLPLLGRIDSLNLSATAAVLFYEALRQRSQSS